MVKVGGIVTIGDGVRPPRRNAQKKKKTTPKNPVGFFVYKNKNHYEKPTYNHFAAVLSVRQCAAGAEEYSEKLPEKIHKVLDALFR